MAPRHGDRRMTASPNDRRAGLVALADQQAVRAGISLMWERRFGEPMTDSEWDGALRLYEVGSRMFGWRVEFDGILAALRARAAQDLEGGRG